MKLYTTIWLSALAVSSLGLAGCGGGAGGVDAQMVTRAQLHDPAASQQTLELGKQVLETRCGDCHTTPTPSDEPTREWPRLVSRMGNLSELTKSEELALLHYVLGASQN